VQLPVALVLPSVATRVRRQYLLIIAAVALTGIGFAGILLAPVAAAPLWVVVLGVGQGAAFPLSLTFLVLRADTPDATAQLSTMAQSVGYLIAALGPLLVGALHASTGGWRASLVLLLALLVPELYAGLRAAVPRVVAGGKRPA
jgi:CP family cyanate transporter-like MFS transporter